MTNELEKQFFDTFGIEPKLTKFEIKYNERGEITYPPIYTYPQITDRHLLELICIINQSELALYGEYDCFMAVNYKDLKEEVVAKCKRLADKNSFSEVTGEHIKHQVQALFKEG